MQTNGGRGRPAVQHEDDNLYFRLIQSYPTKFRRDAGNGARHVHLQTKFTELLVNWQKSNGTPFHSAKARVLEQGYFCKAETVCLHPGSYLWRLERPPVSIPFFFLRSNAPRRVLSRYALLTLMMGAGVHVLLQPTQPAYAIPTLPCTSVVISVFDDGPTQCRAIFSGCQYRSV